MTQLAALDILTEVAHRDAEIKEEEEQVSAHGWPRPRYTVSARSCAYVAVFRRINGSNPNFAVSFTHLTHGIVACIHLPVSFGFPAWLVWCPKFSPFPPP